MFVDLGFSHCSFSLVGDGLGLTCSAGALCFLSADQWQLTATLVTGSPRAREVEQVFPPSRKAAIWEAHPVLSLDHRLGQLLHRAHL